jgi:signal transduction histidine kinase
LGGAWRGLRARLFLSYAAVTAVALVTLAAAATSIAPTLFLSHMASMMHGEQTGSGLPAMPGMEGMMRGGMRDVAPPAISGAMDAAAQEALTAAFRSAVASALLYAAGAAALASLIASTAISHLIASPVRRLAVAARHVAAGHYGERVPPSGTSGAEIADLATQFNAMAAALAETEQRRVRLVGDVAHELRTPVATLAGYLEGLADGVIAPDTGTFARLHVETGRLSRLVDDLQELSRAEAGQLSLDLKPVGPGELIDAATARLRPDYQARGVDLKVDAPPGLPAVNADPERAVQVLTNLLTNALRHSEAGGTVRVTARAVPRGSGGEVEFAVVDTGAGIAPEHLPHLFERFYRADPSRSRALGGSGIGLTIGRAIVEALGGRIWAESAGLGRGATFRFTLPVAAPPARPS